MVLKIIKLIKNPRLIGNLLPKWKWARYLPDSLYLKILFRLKVGYKLNLTSPKSFNEKMQWLKLHDHNPKYIKMVDKYEAKKYIAQKWGKEYVIPTLGIWNSFDEIEFDKLPEQFVLKCTHDSGGLVIVKDKKTFDKLAAKKKLEKSLSENYFYTCREWPYKNIKPRIIAEQYIKSSTNISLNDYKLMCFNGKVRCSFVCSNRFGREGLYVNFYDDKWNPMPFIRKYPKNPIEIEKPRQYEEMVILAESIAKKIPFVRVDFYECNDKIYFGEFTFYPGAGVEWFEPRKWDDTLGSWLQLPNL